MAANLFSSEKKDIFNSVLEHSKPNLKPFARFSHLKIMEKQFCSKCGAENVTHSAWCEKCLKPFGSYGDDKILRCPACFHPNDYVQDHCEVCHEPLKPGQVE